MQQWVVGLVLGASACSSSNTPSGAPQATETEGDGDGDGDSGDGDGDSGDGDGDGDGDSGDGDGDGDDEPACMGPGEWEVADPGACLRIGDPLRKVDPPGPHNYVLEERGHIAIDGAGKAHIVTQRVHWKDVEPDNPETGEHVDTRIIYRTNESGAWVEKVLSNTSDDPWGLSVTADGDVTLVNSDAIFVRIDGVWSVGTFPGHWLPTERTIGFDPVSNFVYVQMQTVADGYFVLGGPPDCLQRIIEIPDGCEPELELKAADVGKPGTLDLLARGPADNATGFEELAHLHYEAGTLERQILTSRHTDTHYLTLAVQPDGTLHTCTEVSYEHGQDADSWISVDWQQPGFNVWPMHCQVATTDAGDTWMTYKAFAANADEDPSYIGHIVDGHVELEVMGTVSQESTLSARSIVLGPDGEPHVLAQHGLGHRYFFREGSEWTSIDFFP